MTMMMMMMMTMMIMFGITVIDVIIVVSVDDCDDKRRFLSAIMTTEWLDDYWSVSRIPGDQKCEDRGNNSHFSMQILMPWHLAIFGC